MVGGATCHRNKYACPSDSLMNLFRDISAVGQNLNEFENADTRYILPVWNNILFVWVQADQLSITLCDTFEVASYEAYESAETVYATSQQFADHEYRIYKHYYSLFLHLSVFQIL